MTQNPNKSEPLAFPAFFWSAGLVFLEGEYIAKRKYLRGDLFFSAREALFLG